MALAISTASAKNPKLTIWIRAGGVGVKPKIAPFVQNVLASLPQNVFSKVLVCTNPGDPILESLDTVAETGQAVRPVFAQLSSFSSALTTLAQNTDPESDVLTLSVGIRIRPDQIKVGLAGLSGRVKVYGWEVAGYGNDGSCPGRGWYNTAALIHRTVIGQMREGIPRWVDNGVLETRAPYTIGGNEEIPIMVEALRRDPSAEFVLNPDPVSSDLEIGTGISFAEKLARKVVVGRCYMLRLHRAYCRTQGVNVDFCQWQARVWASVKVITLVSSVRLIKDR